MTQILTMQPGELKHFAVDLVDKIKSGDSLASVTSVTGSPSGLTISATGISGTTVTFSATTETEATYLISAIAVTTDGETLEGNGYLIVADVPADPSGLELAYTDILSDLAEWMGWGRSGWDADQILTLDSILRGGLSQFYWPPPLPGERTAHSWSFLKPITSLDTVIDQEDYDLPSDFGGLIGQFYYAAGEDVWHPIRDTGPGAVLSLRSRNLSSGAPKFAAVVPKASTGTATQGWTLALVPAADAVYTVKYRYQVIPNAMRVGTPYHLGNAVHSQTLLQSCLAIAERRYRDTEGIQQAAFDRALAASVAHDRRMAPGNLGENRNGGGVAIGPRRDYVTYNGVLYTGD